VAIFLFLINTVRIFKYLVDPLPWVSWWPYFCF
jgi:hypothetical protein